MDGPNAAHRQRHRRRANAYHRPIASDHAPPDEAKRPIRLFLADVDGTLVTQEKVLTDDAIAAVRRLRQAGVLFALTSGRPPRGMEMLLAPLDVDTPIAAFFGGRMVDKDMKILEEHALPEDIVEPISDHMQSFDLDVWLYRGADWYVPDPKRAADLEKLRRRALLREFEGYVPVLWCQGQGSRDEEGRHISCALVPRQLANIYTAMYTMYMYTTCSRAAS